MTLHAAKGLEFPVVFITGCEEGLIPYKHTSNEAHKPHGDTKNNENNPPSPPFAKGGNTLIPPLEKGDTGGFSDERQSDISEERRLFYVGLTRTQEKLFLSYARKRLLFGTRSSQKISPFLQDIEQDLKKYENPFSRKPLARIQDAQLSLFDGD